MTINCIDCGIELTTPDLEQTAKRVIFQRGEDGEFSVDENGDRVVDYAVGDVTGRRYTCVCGTQSFDNLAAGVVERWIEA